MKVANHGGWSENSWSWDHYQMLPDLPLAYAKLAGVLHLFLFRVDSELAQDLLLILCDIQLVQGVPYAFLWRKMISVL